MENRVRRKRNSEKKNIKIQGTKLALFSIISEQNPKFCENIIEIEKVKNKKELSKL